VIGRKSKLTEEKGPLFFSGKEDLFVFIVVAKGRGIKGAGNPYEGNEK
jgi:hypothetical protein